MDARTLAIKASEKLVKGGIKNRAGERGEHYRKRARALIKAYRDGDEESLARLLEEQEAARRE